MLLICRRRKVAPSPRTWKDRQYHQVGRDGEPDLNDAAVAHDGFTVDKIDLHVVVLEKCLIERIDSLVDSLLGGEKEPTSKRIISDLQPLSRRSDQIHQLRWQALGRLDVDAERAYVRRSADCSDRHTSIMGQRAHHTHRPDRCARWRPRYRTLGISEARQELTDGDTSGAAGPSYLDDARGECGGFLRQQSMLVAGRDQTMSDQDAGKGERVERRLKQRIERDGHLRRGRFVSTGWRCATLRAGCDIHVDTPPAAAGLLPRAATSKCGESRLSRTLIDEELKLTPRVGTPNIISIFTPERPH